MSLIVLNVTIFVYDSSCNYLIFVYDSSCNYLIFGLILANFLFLSIYYVALPRQMSRNRYEREDKIMRPKKRELHELLYLEIVKSGTFRLASVRCELNSRILQFLCMTEWDGKE